MTKDDVITARFSRMQRGSIAWPLTFLVSEETAAKKQLEVRSIN